jgi:leader peptidase (prepilin peptidase)/N-methyltransferase
MRWVRSGLPVLGVAWGWAAKPYTSVVTPLFLYEIIGFVLGLLFGSFLNVCISRLPRHESIVHPRSRCPECGAGIRWYDNIPVLSWLWLRGRCRDCKRSIPWRYPLVELASGFWFVVVGQEMFLLQLASRLSGPTPVAYIGAFAFAILGFLLIGLMVMDWQTGLLPDTFTLSGIAIALFLVCTQAIFLGPTEGQVILSNHRIHLTSPGNVVDRGNVFLTGPEALIFGRVLAVCGVALILLVVRWVYKAVRHREGMGLGDVKLLAMIAAFLGFWPAVLALFVGVLLATLYAVALLVRGKAGAASRLAFGSFLALGGLTSALFGGRLIDMYTTLLR